MPTEAEQAQALYAELKPLATADAREYVTARTPAELQVEMTALIDADFPPPAPLADAAKPALPPPYAVSQMAAQLAAAEAGTAKIDEVKSDFAPPAPPPPPAPAPTS